MDRDVLDARNVPGTVPQDVLQNAPDGQDVLQRGRHW